MSAGLQAHSSHVSSTFLNNALAEVNGNGLFIYLKKKQEQKNITHKGFTLT